MPRSTQRRKIVQTGSVGRAGRLALNYVRQGARTVFARTNCRSPWHLFPPIYLDDTGAAYTLLLNPSGGLVGGDRLSIDMHLGQEAHVLISTPSANRVYRSLAETSVQDIKIRLDPGAILEWFPEHTIPFAGSRFRQSIHVQLAEGATVLLWDAIASGRIARGERWGFTSLDNEIRITTAAGLSVKERYVLKPADSLSSLGLAEEWDYVGSLFLIGDRVETGSWTALESTVAEILETNQGQVLGAVSRPAAPGLAVKLVARSAPALTAMVSALWAAVRKELWDLPVLNLRKY
jgi:urease accessory protein